MTNQSSDKLTSILLDGKNYNIWARQASFGLIGREKLEYVNGEIPMPVPNVAGAPTKEEKRAIREWRKNDNRVAGWLLATVEPHISKIMTFQDSAQGMWKKAERLYGKKKLLTCISIAT
jgi:gag-polypeptide of LTR copia-type